MTDSLPPPISELEEIDAIVTGYCNCHICTDKSPGDAGYGVTASGRRAHTGTAATDWRALPKGTRLHIPGLGRRVVEDKGGAMRRAWRKWGRYAIDVWFPTHDEALQWGRRKLRVRILR